MQYGGARYFDMILQVKNNGNDLEVIRLKSTGRVGIGVSTPTEALEVNGNVKATNLTGISNNSNLQLHTTDYTTATIISNHLHVNLNGMTYKPHLGIRAHKDDMTDTQEVMIQVGKNHTKAITFIYIYDDTAADYQYRLDFAGRTAYECLMEAQKQNIQ